LWQRPSESTNLHNRERTSGFVMTYGDLPIRAVDDEHVAAWLKGGRNHSTVPALRAMFNDAASAAAGRLVDRNPFAALGLPGSRGRKDVPPPTQAEMARLLVAADQLTPPSDAALLDVGAHERMRSGELDALRWTKIDFRAGTILVDEQWCAKTQTFTLPKHGVIRTIALTEPARKRLLALPRESEFAFTTLRGSHYRPSSRSHHWKPCPLLRGSRPLLLLHRDTAFLRLVHLERARARRA
jgi:integrase